MRRFFLLLLLFSVNISNAANSVVAVVNEDVITFDSIEWQFNVASSHDEKMDIISQQVDLLLQLDVAKKLGIEPENEEIEGALMQLARNSNVSLIELKSHPQFTIFAEQIIGTLSAIKLEQYITKDFKFELSENEILQNCNTENSTGVKQIKIAQIIISEILDPDSSKIKQKNAVIEFLKKLSKHISKGASFEAFAKLHSQHPSYYNGGLSEWLFIDTPNIEMFDSLKEGAVSKIYETDGGWAIAIKAEERYIDPDIESCKKQIKKRKSNKYYSKWLKDLRESAYIEIYTDKL
jgi:peptidyl-prolyl cis-trans isomerase SurA|tara:strand:+ start:87 stop:965 length:879 start_codon:yes stop_codon:yes gene_type:complete